MKMVEEVFQTDSDRQQDKGTMCQNYRLGFSKVFVSQNTIADGLGWG